MMNAGYAKHEGLFLREPTGAVYRRLICTLAETATYAILVQLRHGRLEEMGTALLEQLQPWLHVAEERDTWPGTSLSGGKRMVYEYNLSSDVVAILQEAVEGLYGWLHGLPEDLGLVREDGETLLYSVAHEEEGGLFVLPAERDYLLKACPEIAGYVNWRK